MRNKQRLLPWSTGFPGSCGNLLGVLGCDLRHSFRIFTRNRGFAAAALLSLAIGIGANTALFSIANGLLLCPLPYREPGGLVILWNRSPGLGITEDWFSTAQYFDIRNSQRGFEDLAILIGGNVNLTGGGEPERVGALRVSSNLLPMLGIQPVSGRGFLAGEDSPGLAATAMLSHGMWVRRYGMDPAVVGSTIILNGLPYQVVGILPPSFSLPREVVPTLGGAEQADVLLPLPLGPKAAQVRTREDYNIVGRLKTGITIEQAQAEMDALTSTLRRDYPNIYPPNGGLTFSIVPLLEEVIGETRRPLYILLGSVGLVLLVACANAANLLLARAVSRRKEVAVRAAFGAGRGRIIRQLLTESTTLALGGGALGILLASWSLDWIRVLGPASVPRLQDVVIDGRVLVFTLLVSVCTGFLFGLAPAFRVTRIDLNATLKESGRDAAGVRMIWGRGHNLRRLLVVTELALSVVLLIGAGLLVRSFARLQDVQPGFNARNVLTFGLTLTGRQYGGTGTVLAAYRQLWERMEAVPGVTASGGVSQLPLTRMFAWTPISIEGREPLPGEKFINADERIVSGDYFQAMEIPLLRGRFFTDQDREDSLPVTIIDERMAQEFWPGQDPIGKRIRHGDAASENPWMTVIGVVGRVRHDALDSNPRIVFHLPHTQAATRSLNVVVRSSGDPGLVADEVSAAVRNLDPELPAYNVRTMDQIVDESLARQRFTMLLLGVFAVTALALAATGVYGVMSYMVIQGTRDIGIRIALGARQSEILGMIVRRGMALAVLGAAIGVAVALGLTPLMAGLLFGVSTIDPLTFTAIPAILLLVALLATYLPARRAARVDPMVSLRCE